MPVHCLDCGQPATADVCPPCYYARRDESEDILRRRVWALRPALRAAVKTLREVYPQYADHHEGGEIMRVVEIGEQALTDTAGSTQRAAHRRPPGVVLAGEGEDTMAYVMVRADGAPGICLEVGGGEFETIKRALQTALEQAVTVGATADISDIVNLLADLGYDGRGDEEHGPDSAQQLWERGPR